MVQTESRSPSIAGRVRGFAARQARRAGAVAALSTATLLAVGSLSPSPSRAQYAANNSGGPHFAKFGKTYVNLSLATHVISDPGYGLPPGTMQVYFGAQSYINLYGDDAEALRRVLDEGISPHPLAPPPMMASQSAPAAASTPTAAAPAAAEGTPTAAATPKPAAKRTKSTAPVKKAAPKAPLFDTP